MTQTSARPTAWAAAPRPSGAATTVTALGVPGLLAVVVGLLATGASAATLVADPGAVTRWGQPLLRVVQDVSASLTVGLLVVAALLLPPSGWGTRARGGAPLGGVGLRATRLAGAAGGVWVLAGAVGLLLTWSRVSGYAITDPAFGQGLAYYLTHLDTLRSLVVAVLLAAVVATGATVATRQVTVGWMALLSVVALLPVALTGHAAGATDHEPGRRQPGVPPGRRHRLGRRPGRAAAAAARPGRPPGRDGVALLGSGARRVRAGRCVGRGQRGAAARRPRRSREAPTARWWSPRPSRWCCSASPDGGTAAGCSAGSARAATLPPGRSAGWPSASLVVMGVATGLAVALSLSAPPAGEGTGPEADAAFAITGYSMPAPLTAARFVTAWRPDLLWCSIAAVLLTTYLVGAARMRRRGDGWPVGRTVAWVAGCLVLVYATSGAPGIYGRVLFSAHMLGHMTMSMVVPPLLVLGAPVTLALRSLQRRTDGTLGPREWLLEIVHSRLLRVLGNPLVAAGLFAVSLIAFYYSPLFGLALKTHTGHVLMHVHFLLTGYLFASVLIGVDPGPPRPAYPLRLLLLFATMAFHAFFGVTLMQGNQAARTGRAGGARSHLGRLAAGRPAARRRRGLGRGRACRSSRSAWASPWRGCGRTTARPGAATGAPTGTATPSLAAYNAHLAKPGRARRAPLTASPGGLRPDGATLRGTLVRCASRWSRLSYDDDESPQQRRERVAALVRAQAGHDLVLLPEPWPAGGFAYRDWADRAEPVDGPTLEAMSAAARDAGVVLHAGSVVERAADGADRGPQGRGLWNTSLLLGPDGGLLATYRKVHRFGFGSGEPVLLEAGADVVTVDVPRPATGGAPVRLGLTTCYDLRFPELYRRLLDDGARVVLVPAAWPAARVAHWTLLGRARAVEDQVFVVAGNTAGTHAGHRMGGRSQVVGPLGEVLAEAGEGEQVLSVEPGRRRAGRRARRLPRARGPEALTVFYAVVLAIALGMLVASYRRSGGEWTRYLTGTGAPVVWVLLGGGSLLCLLVDVAGEGSLAQSLFVGGLIGTALVQVVLLRQAPVRGAEGSADAAPARPGATGDGDEHRSA
nr:cytochrome c oxidase assembly protein [Angustibacter aerolatus]